MHMGQLAGDRGENVKNDIFCTTSVSYNAESCVSVNRIRYQGQMYVFCILGLRISDKCQVRNSEG